MTGPGTNTYLVGIDEIAVIDPGPADDDHLDAVAGCGGDRIRWILLTHTHEDHAPGTAGLVERTGAEVLAFDARDGIEPDRTWPRATRSPPPSSASPPCTRPGHASNHLCYLLEEECRLFSGDHIMEGSTVVIRPPDGDMADLPRLAAPPPEVQEAPAAQHRPRPRPSHRGPAGRPRVVPRAPRRARAADPGRPAGRGQRHGRRAGGRGVHRRRRGTPSRSPGTPPTLTCASWPPRASWPVTTTSTGRGNRPDRRSRGHRRGDIRLVSLRVVADRAADRRCHRVPIEP